MKGKLRNAARMFSKLCNLPLKHCQHRGEEEEESNIDINRSKKSKDKCLSGSMTLTNTHPHTNSAQQQHTPAVFKVTTGTKPLGSSTLIHSVSMLLFSHHPQN